jgi:DNA adenine methylase
MSVPHPIPYQGSKRALAPLILSHFPKDATRLIEPFAGSAAVALLAAQRRPVDQFVLNDVNAPLMHLWSSIINQPERLGAVYERLWQAQTGRERHFYDLVRTRFNKTQQPYYLLYLLARCVKASVRYNASGEFNQSPDNRRKGRQPRAMRQDIEAASRLLRHRTMVLSGDYRKVLAIATPNDIVYLDPPYQGVCATRDARYLNGVSVTDFVKTLEDLNKRNISYILSYDGRTGTKTFGQPLPASLQLTRIEVNAGRSSQATLLGRTDQTVESLYLSAALMKRNNLPVEILQPVPTQLALFEILA